MSSGELSFESPPFLCVTWNIPDFFKLTTETECTLQSPDFTFDDDRCCLQLVKTQKVDTSGKYEYLEIILLNLIDTDTGGEVSYEVQLKSGTEEIDINCIEGVFGINRSTLEDERDLYVPDGTLTVLCSILLITPRSAESGETQTQVIPKYRISGKLSSESFPLLYVTWRIPGFFHLARESIYSLESPEFPFSDRRYYLRLFSSKDGVEVKLVNLTDTVPGRYVSYEVRLQSANEKEIYIPHYCHVNLYISRNDLDKKKSQCFPDGHLTVFCSMFWMLSTEPNSPGSPNSSGTETKVFSGLKFPVPQDATHPKSGMAETSTEEGDKEVLLGTSMLSSDFRQLLQKMPDSDACLVVSGKEFRAHQIILRARSTVFEAMFGHETAERESGRVVIEDLDPGSFGDFLEYLYTGVVGADLSDDSAFGLYEAADKYDVPALKAVCVAHMRRSLSVDSFCDVLAVALRHSEEELLSRSVLFFKENMARIIVTAKWKQFATDNGASANELLIKAVVPSGQ